MKFVSIMKATRGLLFWDERLRFLTQMLCLSRGEPFALGVVQRRWHGVTAVAAVAGNGGTTVHRRVLVGHGFLSVKTKDWGFDAKLCLNTAAEASSKHLKVSATRHFNVTCVKSSSRWQRWKKRPTCGSWEKSTHPWPVPGRSSSSSPESWKSCRKTNEATGFYLAQ